MSNLIRDLLDRHFGTSPHLRRVIRARTELDQLVSETPKPSETADRFTQSYMVIKGDVVSLKTTYPDMDEYLMTRKILERVWKADKVPIDLAYFNLGFDHWEENLYPGLSTNVHENRFEPSHPGSF